MRKFLLGLTNSNISSWKDKVREIDELGLTEIAVFASTMVKAEREELCKALEKTKLKSIPHVHLRNDMEKSEIDFFVEKYKTEAFNIHPERDFHYGEHFRDHAAMIYVENLHFLPDPEELERYAGFCLDVSHWEDAILTGSDYNGIDGIVKKYKIGCSHISAIKPVPHFDSNPKCPDRTEFTDHLYKDLSEFDYVKKYARFLPELVSIELENPLKEQLEVKKYLEPILK